MENNKKKYVHITKTERLEIAVLSQKGYKLREIARVLARSPSSISEEIRNNKVRGAYDPEKADHKAYVRRKYSKYQGMKIVGNNDLRSYVEEHIKEDWSPEEISGRIRKIESRLPNVSFRAIYKFVGSVYGRQLGPHLRYKGKRKTKKPHLSSAKLKDRTFIDQRPNIVDKRQRLGDWEGDFIVSGKNGQGVLLVLHERVARYTLIRKIVHPKIREVHQFIRQMTDGVILNTLTLDNDIIFRKHDELSCLLGSPIYFCHPYHSWEKGGVENTNKLIRQYLPKRSDISKYSDGYIQTIQDKLNNRPRKCLDYKTPSEVMGENILFQNEMRDTIDVLDSFKTTKKAECSA